MSIYFCLFFLFYSVSSFKHIGITKPLGYFDPLGFSNSKPENELVKLHESELKHGRWGMISCVAIPATEIITHKQAIHVLDDAGIIPLSVFITLVTAAEFRSILLGWENPFINSSNYFVMKNDYQPGNLGLNLPQNFLNKDADFMLNAEVNHGRLAMIGSLGMITQELITNNLIF